MNKKRCKRNCGWKGFLQDLKYHNDSCPNRTVICFNFDYGCKWKGLSSSLPSHISSCPFESLKEWINKVELNMNTFSHIINKQNKTIRYLLDKLKSYDDSSYNNNDIEEEQSNIQSLIQDIPLPFTRHIQTSQDISIPKSHFKDKKKELNIHLDHHIIPHKSGVTSLTSYQNLLFSGSHDSTISVIDTDNNHQIIKYLTGHQFTIWSLYHYPHNNILFSGSADKTIKLWNLGDQNQSDISLLKTLDSEDLLKVYSLSKGFSSSLYSSTFKNIVIWDINSCKKIQTLKAHDQAIWSLKPFGNQLLSCSDDGTIKIWDQRKLDQCIESLTHEDSQFLSLEVAGGYIFSGTNHSDIKVWSTSTYQYITTLKSHQWEVWQLIQMGDYLLSGSYDHTIKLWEIKDLGCKKTVNAHKGIIHSLHGFSKDIFYSGGGDKCVNRWKIMIKDEDDE